MHKPAAQLAYMSTKKSSIQPFYVLLSPRLNLLSPWCIKRAPELGASLGATMELLLQFRVGLEKELTTEHSGLVLCVIHCVEAAARGNRWDNEIHACSGELAWLP